MRRWLNSVLPRSNRKVRSVEALGVFLSQQSFFIAQKCSDTYCRGKTGLSYFALAEETAFRDALAVCRWEGYAAMLMALAAVAERHLVDAGGAPERVEARLIELVDKILSAHPLPDHRPGGWSDVLDALPERLRWARADPRPALAEIAAPAARRLFDVLPIHASHRELDDEVVTNAVQFQFVGFSDRFRREVDSGEIGRELNAPP